MQPCHTTVSADGGQLTQAARTESEHETQASIGKPQVGEDATAVAMAVVAIPSVRWLVLGDHGSLQFGATAIDDAHTATELHLSLSIAAGQKAPVPERSGVSTESPIPLNAGIEHFVGVLITWIMMYRGLLLGPLIFVP